MLLSCYANFIIAKKNHSFNSLLVCLSTAQGSKEQANQQAEVPQVEEKNFSDEELTALIDPILTTDDISQDGFIDYPEFIRAQQKSAAQGS